MSSKCQVKCRIREGMFSDELIAEIRAMDFTGRVSTVSSFVPTEAIERDPKDSSRGTLIAYCMRTSRDFTSVVLPQDTLENGASLVVPSEDVLQKEGRS